MEPTIKCPKCKTEIKLTDAVAGPMLKVAQKDFEQRLENAIKIAKTQADKEAVDSLQSTLDEQDKEAKALRSRLREKEGKLADAQKEQASFLEQRRKLEDSQREIDLTIQKKVDAGTAAIRAQASLQAERNIGLKVTEREETIKSMRLEIDNLVRKAEQGSQQSQGEALEVEIEGLLSSTFPFDEIVPVAKGVHGGDILQQVRNPSGKDCGSILWELKRTKTWSDSWLPKLREDQRQAKAEVAILVTQVLPKGVGSFDIKERVWITQPATVVPLATLLRQKLIEVALARQSVEGMQSRSEMVYHYMTGQKFRQRVEAIVEAFSTMREDLNSEKKAVTKGWAKRETQIERVMQGTVGMYGDLQGIAGKEVGEVKGLEFKE